MTSAMADGHGEVVVVTAVDYIGRRSNYRNYMLGIGRGILRHTSHGESNSLVTNLNGNDCKEK